MSVFEQIQDMEIQQIKKENHQLRRMVQMVFRNSQETEFDLLQNSPGNRWSIFYRL